MLHEQSEHRHPLVVIVGPTASGKSALAMYLAERFGAEILCCDAVTVYREMDRGTAKPSAQDRTRVRHHCLDLLTPDQPSTAGDFARNAREALQEVRRRDRLPILAGGSGLYLRALLDGLSPAPARNEAFRERLRDRARRHDAGELHRLLKRLDPAAARKIHPNDEPKLIRSLEMLVHSGQPQTEQWQAGRDRLQGYRILRLALAPARAALYARINERAAGMFTQGLLDETQSIAARYGDDAVALGSLGYAQALGVLRERLTLEEGIAAAQQGHRNYAKRQLTWFRRDPELRWFAGFGDDPQLQSDVAAAVERHLNDQGASASILGQDEA